MNAKLVRIMAASMLVAVAARGVPTWGSVSWNTVTVGGSGYVDGHLDESADPNYSTTPQPETLDIVGNATYPSAYWAIDGQNILFRVRVDGDPGVSPQYVWSAILNTDADSSAEFVLQLDLKTDDQVEIAAATAGGPTPNNWQDLAYVASPHVSPTGGAPTDWYQMNPVTDGSNFADIPPGSDYFIDFGFDLATFYSTTGVTPGGSVSLAFATSANHINSNKDLPDIATWSDPIAVPEPSVVALLATGLGVLALRRRQLAR